MQSNSVTHCLHSPPSQTSRKSPLSCLFAMFNCQPLAWCHIVFHFPENQLSIAVKAVAQVIPSIDSSMRISLSGAAILLCVVASVLAQDNQSASSSNVVTDQTQSSQSQTQAASSNNDTGNSRSQTGSASNSQTNSATTSAPPVTSVYSTAFETYSVRTGSLPPLCYPTRLTYSRFIELFDDSFPIARRFLTPLAAT